MKDKPGLASSKASRTVEQAAEHLGSLISKARRARGMPQAELAERSRFSTSTVHRIEKGSPDASLGAVLALMEQLGLLEHILNLRDERTEELLSLKAGSRMRRKSPKPLDF